MTERRKRLIEVAFPLEEVSAHSRREKNVRHGHISTLHIWWARRPLAACRAFIYESLVDDPPTEAEREELLREVADLASWDAVRKPDEVVRPKAAGGTGRTGRDLLQRARERILRDNGGKPPRLLDPFAGGGAIPLEALRLGCEVEASDLNPVAVLILKGTVEYPQKYGRPLAEQRVKRPDDCAGVDGQVPKYIRVAAKGEQTSFGESDAVTTYEKNPLVADVRHWGKWMLEKAHAELAEFYPPDPDGSLPVAYLWSRTVPCPNCGVEMPLIRQYWLSRKDKKKVALLPDVDRDAKHVDFEIVEGALVTGDPAEATTAAGDIVCLLCRQVAKGVEVREAGKRGQMSTMMTAVVTVSGGKAYRPDTPEDMLSVRLARERLRSLVDAETSDVPVIPDEPMPSRANVTGGVVSAFGYDSYGKLFTDRQLLALVTFSRLVRSAAEEMAMAGASPAYASCVATYLGMAVDRLADYGSSLTRWLPTIEAVAGTFGRQAIPMVWDFVEICPIRDVAGSFPGAMDWISGVIESCAEVSDLHANVVSRTATSRSEDNFDLVVTDPPYYDAINYSEMSDFFYVWMKRSLGTTHPDILGLPLTPKREQLVAVRTVRGEGSEIGKGGEGRARYIQGMAQAFQAMRDVLIGRGPVGIVFAHTDPDAWATLISSSLEKGLVPNASWPIDTERTDKVAGQGQARLATSVWMACRPRSSDAGPVFLGDLQGELRRAVEDRLLDFWSRNIRGADFFISAIGPALSVFGRHSKVLRPDGTEVTVRDFLDIVRRESTRVALQQVLGGETLGAIDPVTQAYVTWAWSYGKAALAAGEAIALCLATGADLGELTRPHAVAEMAKEKSKKVVKLRSVAARAREDDELGQGNGARPTPLIDQLQHSAWLWGANRAPELGKYRAELGEARWKALRTLGQAVAECLPDGDDDRRLINGMLGSSLTAGSAPPMPAAHQQRLEI